MQPIKKYITQYSVPASQGRTGFVKLLTHFPGWLNSLRRNRSPLDDALPWINFDGLAYLKKLIKPEMRVFEFGAGGSSVFFAQHVKHIISVEHDVQWFFNVKQKVEKLGLDNWSGHIIEPTRLLSKTNQDIEDPEQYASGDEKFLHHYSFKEYSSFIDQYDDGYFDMVFIDGRSRPSCIKHSLYKVKAGGYLVIDNSDRNYYFNKTRLLIEAANYKMIFEKFGPGPYGEVFWGTSFYKKVK